jgi:hypothetical protein
LRVLQLLERPRTACLVLAAPLAGAVVPLATNPPIDMDVWWIAAAGRTIRETGHVPTTNMFSFTEPNHPWIMHEWLVGVIFDRGTAWLGPAFFTVFGLLSACAISAVVLLSTLGRARHVPSAALLSALVLLGVLSHLASPRPLYVSGLFAVSVAALAFAPRFGLAALLTCLMLELVWVNSHGSFPLGVALLAAGAWASRADRLQRCSAAIVCASATFANPYGARIAALVAQYAHPRDPAAVLIHDTLGGFMPLWRAPPMFVDLGTSVAWAAVMGVAIAFVVGRTEVARATVALALLLIGALQVRHLVLGVLVSTVLLAPAIDARFVQRSGQDPSSRDRAARTLLALVPAVVVGICAFVSKARISSQEEWIPLPLGGPAFVHMARALPSGARVHAPFGSSGLLLWAAAESRRVRVLYDARNDCYSAELVAAGFALDAATLPGFELQRMLEHYGTDHAILDERSVLAKALLASERWVVRGREGNWIVFERA